MKYKFLFTFILFITGLTTYGQSSIDSLAFPASWQGKYAGNLSIYRADSLIQEIPMELHILPIDSSENFTWTIIYGVDKEAGKRAYELKTVDASKGHYVIDEKNSILLDGYLFGNKFFERFEVMGSLLMTSTEKINEDELVWEIISGKLEPVQTTGGTEYEGQEIPPVRAYPINILQRAHLKRK